MTFLVLLVYSQQSSLQVLKDRFILYILFPNYTAIYNHFMFCLSSMPNFTWCAPIIMCKHLFLWSDDSTLVSSHLDQSSFSTVIFFVFYFVFFNFQFCLYTCFTFQSLLNYCTSFSQHLFAKIFGWCNVSESRLHNVGMVHFTLQAIKLWI